MLEDLGPFGCKSPPDQNHGSVESVNQKGVEASHAHGCDLMATASNLQVKPYAVVKRGCWRQIEKEVSHTRPIDDFR